MKLFNSIFYRIAEDIHCIISELINLHSVVITVKKLALKLNHLNDYLAITRINSPYRASHLATLGHWITLIAIQTLRCGHFWVFILERRQQRCPQCPCSDTPTNVSCHWACPLNSTPQSYLPPLPDHPLVFFLLTHLY